MPWHEAIVVSQTKVSQMLSTHPSRLIACFPCQLVPYTAELEGTIALARFLKRLPDYQLDGAPVRGGRVRFRGFLSVPCS
jgi:hypothetical protein